MAYINKHSNHQRQYIWFSSEVLSLRTNMFDVVDDGFVSEFTAVLVFNMENCKQK